MTSVGSATQRTFEKEGAVSPSWSQDGKWIGYQCTAGPSTHLCMVGADAGESFKVVGASGVSWFGGWFPDNDRMLFAARRDAVWNVAWVSRVSREVKMLTQYTDPHSWVRGPQWDETNHRVVFERAEMSGRIWTVTLPEHR